MNFLDKTWYAKPGWTQVFTPLAWLFEAVSVLRRRSLQNRYQGKAYSVPVVIIGNINVGGTGKTPLIIALTKQLNEAGIRPGVVSRGYGGKAGLQAISVTKSSSVEQCGDEALLIARRTGCPVVVCADRVAAVNHLIAHNEIDLILSDDGLQHYRLHRDIEIVVIDGQRGLGNGRCLPVGPLREMPRRLNDIDAVVVNGSVKNGVGINSKLEAVLTAANIQQFPMTLKATQFINLSSGETVDAVQWARGLKQGPSGQPVHAVAGIGNPERFRDTLAALGLKPQLHRFPDHHAFTISDLKFDDDWPVVMTAKDAVKCESFNDSRHWLLEVEAQIPAGMLKIIKDKLH